MIFKVRGVCRADPEVWHLFGGVEYLRIHLHRVTIPEQRQELSQKQVDWQMIYPRGDHFIPPYEIYEAELNLEGGDYRRILFDTEAYLLNDQGKTVERYCLNTPAEEPVVKSEE